jgi:hypothetical protein
MHIALPFRAHVSALHFFRNNIFFYFSATTEQNTLHVFRNNNLFNFNLTTEQNSLPSLPAAHIKYYNLKYFILSI